MPPVSRRRLLLVLFALLSTWLVYDSLRYGLSEDKRVVLPDLRTLRPKPGPGNYIEHFPRGVLKAQGDGGEYTRTVVVASMSSDNTSWLAHELGDILVPKGPFSLAVYVADAANVDQDGIGITTSTAAATRSGRGEGKEAAGAGGAGRRAVQGAAAGQGRGAGDSTRKPLLVPQNKGHEAMIYLSYLIDHFDHLPDISIFLHAHRFTWHNPLLLAHDAAAMIRYLEPMHVIRSGYVNLRCDWDPGCPEWLYPLDLPSSSSSSSSSSWSGRKHNIQKEEEEHFAPFFAAIFPDTEVPRVVAQPCCAQFAVSAQRVHELGLPTLLRLRNWILESELSDEIVGRLFEYAWQYIFTRHEVECPDMSSCYCGAYGICFEGGRDAFEGWVDGRLEVNELENELEYRRRKGMGRMGNGREKVKSGNLAEGDGDERDVWLQARIANLTGQLDQARDDAFIRGGDAGVRAAEGTIYDG